MSGILSSLFDKPLAVKKIKEKLSPMFNSAEQECQRNGKIGMEVGTLRERILIALLKCEFGFNNVNADLPIAAPEIDVIVKGQPLSIKTTTTKNNKWGYGIKLTWSVDSKTASNFRESYVPSCDILLAQIQWNDTGHLYLFTKQAQMEVMNNIGKNRYIKMPKRGTNTRGVALTPRALSELSKHPHTKKVDVFFSKEKYDPRKIYDRYIAEWS